jgi:bifunctional oligoribonuclease and PAP phosphatase NrnA
LIELEDDLTKCSFRSKGRFDVNAFAKKWGGGGHKTASGAYIKESMDTVLAEMLDEIGKLTGNA